MKTRHPTTIALLGSIAVATAVWIALWRIADRAWAVAEPKDSQPTSRPSRQVDEQLVRKLLGGESSSVDTMDETLARMAEAADRLTDRLDPGDETQRIQAAILTGLDQLIKEAEEARASPSSGRRIRRKTDRAPRGKRRPGSRRPSKSSSAAPSPKPGGGAADTGEKGDRRRSKPDKTDLARQWGFLPQHDRIEVSQGFDEEFLPRFHEQILRYYRDLAREAREASR